MTGIVAVIPACNEEPCIGHVVGGIAPHVDVVVVVDNGSADGTARVARAAGAEVVTEPRRGYGRACLAGLAHARSLQASVVLFLDGDGSDDPADAPQLLAAIADGTSDLALGMRDPSRTERGAMTAVQRFGNWLAPLLMRWTLGAPYRDMPPFKACRVDALDRLDLADVGHGFTIELLVKAHVRGLRIVEVPVACRLRRAGVSKVSGTIGGASRAAVKIVSTIVGLAAGVHAERMAAALRDRVTLRRKRR